MLIKIYFHGLPGNLKISAFKITQLISKLMKHNGMNLEVVKQDMEDLLGMMMEH